jgi:hypothetical protein
MRHILLTLVTLFAGAHSALAKSPFPDSPDKVKSDILRGPDSVLEFISVVTDWIFAVLIAISVIYVLIAAYTYMSSKGGEGVESAHKMLMFAAVGIIVAVLAKGVVFSIRKIVDKSTTEKKSPAAYQINPYEFHA